MSRCGGLARAVGMAAALASPGCIAFRPVPPLDDAERAEASLLAPRLASERFRVVAANDFARDDALDMEFAIRDGGGAIDVVAPTITVEVHPTWGDLHEPLLGFLTLGLLPEPWGGRVRPNWRLVASDGRQIACDTTMDAPAWLGWLVAPIALLPGWELSATWDRATQQREAHSDARRARLALGLARSVARLRDAE